MSTIQVFDRPLCCPSGACEPSVDPELPRFAADLEWLKAKGVAIERYDFIQQPDAFTTDDGVNVQIARHGLGCLPIIRVDGHIVCCSNYPSRERMARWTGVDEAPEVYMAGNRGCDPEVCL